MKSQIDRYLIGVLGTVVLIGCCVILQANAYNEDRGIVKWNPYWFSNSRYADPASYYGEMSRGSGLPKRLGERSSLYGSQQIYKWSPVYFSDRGLFGRSGSGSRYLNLVSNDGLESDD